VIVVVVALTALGSIGGAIVQRSEKRRRKKHGGRNEGESAIDGAHSVPSLPAGQAGDVLHASVTAIIEAARRESDEANQARAETRALRARYDQAVSELEEARRVAERANADLGRCRAHVEQLRAKLDGGEIR